MLSVFISFLGISEYKYELFEPVLFLSKLNQNILQLFHDSCLKVMRKMTLNCHYCC